ncbi:MAG: hypothetical protein DRJ40_02855 [Thermoprotei archaeon]|nr:MAG: hypothetical protein DRJ40_02855 [Thermoprotei archaeon]
MKANFEEMAKHIELATNRIAVSPTPRIEDLLKLAVNIMSTERMIEEALSKTTSEEERKKLEEALKKVKKSTR